MAAGPNVLQHADRTMARHEREKSRWGSRILQVGPLNGMSRYEVLLTIEGEDLNARK